jgi:single-strand DNA-binding protein
MNHIVLIGRLTRDPELRYTPNGVAVANFDLAVNRPGSKEKEVDFIRIIVWQKTAENCANYLKKGRQVAIEGRLQIRSYDDKDGQKKRITEVVANHVEFLGGNKEEKPQDQSQQQQNDEPINLDNLPF